MFWHVSKIKDSGGWFLGVARHTSPSVNATRFQDVKPDAVILQDIVVLRKNTDFTPMMTIAVETPWCLGLQFHVVQ